MQQVDIRTILEAVDITTEEATAYVKYFDYKRQHGVRVAWEHFTVRAFILSIAYLGKGYYSVLRKVKDEVLFRDISELEKFDWLKGWIFYKDKSGLWYIIVDGEKDGFEKFREVYKGLRR